MILVLGLLLHVQWLLAYHVTHVSDCGNSRSCWLMPNGCTNSSDCSAAITWKHTGRSLLIEMECRRLTMYKALHVCWEKGDILLSLVEGQYEKDLGPLVCEWAGSKQPSDISSKMWIHRPLQTVVAAQLKVADNGAWLAVGISKDDLMGNDTVFECHFLPKGKGSVHLSHNLKTTNIMLPEATQTLLRDSYTEERDGRVFCGAEWMLDFTVLDPSEKKMMHKISSGQYHLMLAFGDLDAGSTKKSHALVGEWAPWRSSERTRFCNHCPPHIVDE